MMDELRFVSGDVEEMYRCNANGVDIVIGNEQKELLDRVACQVNSVHALNIDSFCEYVKKYLEVALLYHNNNDECEESAKQRIKKRRLLDLIKQCGFNAQTFDFRFVLLKCLREFCNVYKEVTFEDVSVLARPIIHAFGFNADYLWEVDKDNGSYSRRVIGVGGVYCSLRELTREEGKLCFKSLMYFFLMTVYNEYANVDFKGYLRIDDYPIAKVAWRRLIGFVDVCGNVLNYEDLIIETVRDCDECLRNCVTVWNYVRYPITSQYFEGATLFEDWALYFAEEAKYGWDIAKIQNSFNPIIKKKKMSVISTDKGGFCLDAVMEALQYIDSAVLEQEHITQDKLVEEFNAFWNEYDEPNPTRVTLDLLVAAKLIVGLPDNIILTELGKSFLNALNVVDLKKMSKLPYSSFEDFVVQVVSAYDDSDKDDLRDSNEQNEE